MDAVLKGKAHPYTVVVSTFEAACEAEFELTVYTEHKATVTTALPDVPPGSQTMTEAQRQQQEEMERRRQQQRQMRLQEAQEEEDGGACVIL